MTALFYAFVSALCFFVASCDAFGVWDDVQFSTNLEEYSPGDTVEVYFLNTTPNEVGLNLCSAYLALEKRVQKTWQQAQEGMGSPSGGACTAEMIRLRPGGFQGSVALLRGELEAGEYRITTRIEIDEKADRATTNSFAVTSVM